MLLLTVTWYDTMGPDMEWLAVGKNITDWNLHLPPFGSIVEYEQV